MNGQTYIGLDATDLAKLIANREVTPKELVEQSLQQLKNINPSLNAVIHSRKERALAEAKRHEVTNGHFAGVPMLLKNISQALEGKPLTAGTALLQSSVADADSHFVRKCRDAGFLIEGHTNTPELALKNITEPALYGASRNPWHSDYSPGGSSGGSAAAVASGVVPIAGANDGGGSIRIPASWTSLFGLKPTRGRTPVGPGAGRQWQGAAVDFVLSRSVRDSAAMLDQLQVVQPEAAFQTPLFAGSYQTTMQDSFVKPLKIAFTTNSPAGTPVSAEAKAAVEKTMKMLEAQGHMVEEKENNVDGRQLMRNYFLMNSGEVAGVIRQLERAMERTVTSDQVELETWMLNIAGRSVSAAAFSEGLGAWDDASAQMEKLHETYDFYVTPTTAYTAPKVGELTYSAQEAEEWRARMRAADANEQQDIIYEMFLPSLTYTPFTQLANLTGQPAISVPVHKSAEGLPLGVQVIASKGCEHRLLQLACQLEQSDLWVGMQGNPYFTEKGG